MTLQLGEPATELTGAPRSWQTSRRRADVRRRGRLGPRAWVLAASAACAVALVIALSFFVQASVAEPALVYPRAQNVGSMLLSLEPGRLAGVIALSLGLLASLIGLAIGWNRLKRKLLKHGSRRSVYEWESGS